MLYGTFRSDRPDPLGNAVLKSPLTLVAIGLIQLGTEVATGGGFLGGARPRAGFRASLGDDAFPPIFASRYLAA